MSQAFLTAVLLACAAADSSFFLAPLEEKVSGPELALVLIQGATCPVGGYRPLAEAIQKASPYKLWVGVPQFLLDTPEPAQYGFAFDGIMSTMKKAGMKAEHTVIAAHSLGAVMSQIYLTSTGKGKADGLVLMGATVLRKNRNSTDLPPTLTVDGDLDGLLHVTRQAEAYFHQVEKVGGPQVDLDRPVVLLEGLNHWSFSSGDLPSNVANNDIQAEVAMEEGHATIAGTISDFMVTHFGAEKDKPNARAALVRAVEKTGELLNPVMEAMHMEGYRYFNPPCQSDYPTNPTCNYPKYPDKSLIPGSKAGPPNPMPPSDCTCGSEWVAKYGMKMMAGFEGTAAATATIIDSDAFQDVSDVRPFHLPHIFEPEPGTACKDPASCRINVTTVTMPIYDLRDALDTGLYPVTVSEYRTKFKSREALQQQAGLQDVNFTETDKLNTQTCRLINQAAYDWALNKASPKALARFKKYGQPFVFVEDLKSGIGPTGPTWIHDALKFEPSDDKKVVKVQSHYFTTGNKNLGKVSFLETVGYHYCKLLSPARAMEWIYVDGLKEFYGTKPKNSNTALIV
eukprot:TRINITY_DN40617_c0_g1_i1.p1 TRINITY_DN40617_c0_g1~~TRINITY_DN40617_c0_g1_i1.p1  ORF type:complete len:568 (-),score=118.73 TRINITY_DN40617_c0_g1_i1:93-1796(-)